MVALVVAGIVIYRWYSLTKGERSAGILSIFKAFQDVQLVVAHESNIDLSDLGDFVKSLSQKDKLFTNDNALLTYIEEYYKRCAELNRKNERIRITQTREELEMLMNQRNQLVQWFRGQDKIIRHHFSRYITV
jgi:galactose mutarotase-like enzyme